MWRQIEMKKIIITSCLKQIKLSKQWLLNCFGRLFLRRESMNKTQSLGISGICFTLTTDFFSVFSACNMLTYLIKLYYVMLQKRQILCYFTQEMTVF